MDRNHLLDCEWWQGKACTCRQVNPFTPDQERIHTRDEILPNNNQLFINRKTGKLYFVQSVAIDTTSSRDGTKVVIYRAVEDIEKSNLFVRGMEEFKLEFIPADEVPRC